MSAVEKPPIAMAEPAGLSVEDRAWVLAIVAEKDRLIDELRGEAAALRVRVAELEAELRAARKTPWNSSLPPSTEHPHANTAGAGEAAAKAGSTKKRKRGGAGNRGIPSTSGHWFPSSSVTRSYCSSRRSVGAAARHCGATTPSRCGIRCGSCRNRSRSSRNISVID